MKNHSHKMLPILTTGFCLFLALFISCKHEFIQAPTPLQGTALSRNAAPENVTASNGREKIYLSWQELTGAVRYYIYATDAATPREEDFVQITQTTATSIELDVNPGSTVWYKISAVDSSYNESKKSIAVRGSTLACPEITAIENIGDKESGEISIVLDWFMSNCDDSTYRSFIEYDIKYTPEGSTENVQTYRASDLEVTHLVLENLDPHTKYDFQIVARNTNYGDTQESLVLNQETLHRLRPSAPISLTATKGESKDGITLKFTLPEQADIHYKDGTYIKIPLTFKIFRRRAGAGNWPTTGTPFTPTGDYQDGTEVSWTDDIADDERGKKFEYKVQSYVDESKLDDIKTLIGDSNDANYTYLKTSDVYAYSIAEGWATAKPLLSTKNYTPVKDSENAESYSSASTGFIFTWDNFLSDSSEENDAIAAKYHYHLYKTLTKFDIDGGTVSTDSDSSAKSFRTIAELNSYVETFELPAERGTYSFTVYISESETASNTSYLECTPQQALIVTDNCAKIDGLQVDGGYTDKFVISWNYNTDYEYILTYTQVYNGNDEVQTYSVTGFAKESNGPISINDDTNMNDRDDGVTRTYTLSAIQTGGTVAPISQTYEPVESLGKPRVEFDSTTPAYDSITVSWKKVCGANGYTIKIANKAENDVTVSEEDVYSYTFSPEELEASYYADASKSGNDLTVTVKANSDKASSTGTVSARTLGPAKIGLTAEKAQDYDNIGVTWTPVAGAAGYIIQRVRYEISGTNLTKDTNSRDCFFIDASNFSISSNGGEAIPNSKMSVSQTDDGKLKFTDKFAELDDTENPTQTQKTQSMIPWGIPIEYTVVPVLNVKDKYTDGNLSFTKDGHPQNIAYTNTTSIADKGSTFGYGLNLRASKAEDSKSIILKWDIPFIQGSDVQPLVFKKSAGTSSAFEIEDQSISSNNIHEDTITINDCNAYEFAVKYVKNGYAGDPFVGSYMKKLSETKDDAYSPTEQLNKGYTFRLPGLIATGLDSMNNESFTETVTWSAWNSNIRALGPEDINGTPAYTIWQKNLNNASGWFQIGSMDAAGNVTAIQNAPTWYDTDIEPLYYGLTLTPTGVNDNVGCNNGLLKVQRDAKHYYMICAQRKVDDKTVYSYIGLDDSVSTYRKITPEEFAKCVMLIIADATNQTAVTEKENESWCHGALGSYQLYHKSASKTLVFGTGGSNYVHYFYDLPGQRCTDTSNKSNSVKLKSGFTIKFATVGQRSAADGNKIHYFPNTNVTVTHENGRSSYEGTVSFTVGTEGHTGITVLSDGITTSKTITVSATQNSGGSKTLSGNDTDTMEKIFPFKMFTSLGTHYHCCLNLGEDDIKKLPQYSLENWWKIQIGDTKKEAFLDKEE